MNKVSICLCILFIYNIRAQGQDRNLFENMPSIEVQKVKAVEIRLWDNNKSDNYQALYPVLPDKDEATGGAVIICPGGGYRYHAGHEGFPVAKFLADQGIAAFVLRYSLLPERFPKPLKDLQKSITYLRKHNETYNIDTNKIAVIGFSAGGHLAAMSGVHFNKKYVQDNVSLKPNHVVVLYPFISNSITGKTSEFIAEDGNSIIISAEKNVQKDSPPFFLLHARNDEVVSYENHTMPMVKALQEKNIPYELHLFNTGGHGFGTRSQDKYVMIWKSLVLNWLRKYEY